MRVASGNRAVNCRIKVHTNILVRTNRGIAAPADLKGKRVGVPEYQQTVALWSRGNLEHAFGVSARDIECYMECGSDKSHGGATGFQPPPGVRLHQPPPSTTIGGMLMGGELDATVPYLNNRNLVDRSTLDLDWVDVIKPLFRDKQAEMRRYLAKTGIYPINHTVVIKRELFERHPWLVLNLFHAFVEARKDVERVTVEAMKSFFDTGSIDPGGQTGLHADPKAYGIKASRRVIETISHYVHEQGLTDRRVAIEELFAGSTIEV